MIPNPWVLLAVVLAWAASLAGVGYWQRQDGAAATEARYEKRDNEALVAANATIERLNREARATEYHQGEVLAQIGESHVQEMSDAETRRRTDVADARAGRIVLRVPGARPSAGAGAAPEAAAAAGERHGQADAQLPGAVTADLLELADDADDVAVQLGKCQAVIDVYLKGSS